jgi:hypothetical protein
MEEYTLKDLFHGFKLGFKTLLAALAMMALEFFLTRFGDEFTG